MTTFIPEVRDEAPLYEIVHGERRDVKRWGAFEAALASVLIRHLGECAQTHKLGVVVWNVLFVLNGRLNVQRRPNVAFVSYSRWRERTPPDTEAWNAMPDLAVEIISPTNLARELDVKITDYFAAGVKRVWVIHPNSGRVYVYASPNDVRVVNRGEELDGGDVLPGFRLAVEALYEAVTRPE
jgi:Uma2 family endonuclease